jgi:hypothetical protein
MEEKKMADTPYIKYGVQSPDAKRMYFSEPSAARRIPRTVKGGYGILEHGMLMAENLSVATKGKLVPYDMDAVTGTELSPCRAYLLSDVASGATTVEVAVNDSYKFEVGDELVIRDSATTYTGLGAITAIDRAAYPHKVVITVATAAGAAFTTAQHGYVAIKGVDVAVGILDKSVDTYVGADAKDANTVLLLGNAVLYAGVVTNQDSAGLNDINASAVSQFLNIP